VGSSPTGYTKFVLPCCEKSRQGNPPLKVEPEDNLNIVRRECVLCYESKQFQESEFPRPQWVPTVGGLEITDKTLKVTLREAALAALLERSKVSLLLYPILVGAARAFTPLSEDQLAYFWVVLALNVLFAVFRFGLNRWLEANGGPSARLWFAGGVLLQALAWAAFTGPMIYHFGTSTTSLLVLIMVAGISAGALSVYAPDPAILRMHIAVNFFPILLAATLSGNGFLLGVLLLFGTFLLIQSRYQYRWFVNAVTYNFELEQSREELERHRCNLEELVSERTSALTKAISELARANRLKSEFLATMSHELRTPLNAIIGFSEVLHDGLLGDLSEKQADYTQEISKSGHHLLSLINDILDLSKIEAGKQEVELSETDCKMLCENAILVVKERANQGGVELSLNFAESIGPLWTDQRKLKQIMFNLLSNAVKFTPKGGRVTVSVGLESPSSIIFSVQDTGIGISPDDHLKVFLPFEQLGDFITRNHQGTGLGLALCKQLVKLLDGELSVESELGQGARFQVKLPYPGAPLSQGANQGR
jgi:signal transduction histidine kinase